MSFDRVTQILSQYTESTRMFGEKSGIRINMTHAEACMSHDKSIRGSIKSSTYPQTTWNICEIVSKVPQELESDVYERVDPLNESTGQPNNRVAQAARRFREDRRFVCAREYNGIRPDDLLVFIYELVSLFSNACAWNVKSFAPRAGRLCDVALGTQSGQMRSFQ